MLTYFLVCYIINALILLLMSYDLPCDDVFSVIIYYLFSPVTVLISVPFFFCWLILVIFFEGD